MFILFGTLCFLYLDICLLLQAWEVFSHNFIKCFFFFFFLTFFSILSSGTPMMLILVCLMLSQRSLTLFQFFQFVFLFTVFMGDFHHSTFHITYAFSISSLLFIPSCVLFIWVIVFFSSDWFLFIFPSSLLKFSLCSSILFPNSLRSLITNALSSLSSKLFISLSLVVFF